MVKRGYSEKRDDLGLLEDHARHCIAGGASGGDPEALTAELMGAVARRTRRG